MNDDGSYKRVSVVAGGPDAHTRSTMKDEQGCPLSRASERTAECAVAPIHAS
jgi:hypothetical protein